MTKRAMGIFLIAVLLLTLLMGCAGEREGTQDNFAVMQKNGLASVGDVIYAMPENNGEPELHAFDRATGKRSVVDLSAIEKDEGLLIGQKLVDRLLMSGGGALYATDDGGSGGYLCMDVQNGTFERIGFYPGEKLNAWAFVGEKVYMAMQDAGGYGLYAVKSEEMEMFGSLPEPLLRREESGYFDVMYAEGEQLVLFEKKPQHQWYDLIRYDPETDEETLLAENVNTDMAPRIGDTYMICRYAGKEDGYELYRTEVVLLDENGKQITKVMDVDGLWRAAAAGGKFVLDHMYAEHIKGEHEVYVIDPKNLERIDCALMGKEYGVIIGGDEKYVYFWSDAQNVSCSSELLALDVETLEVVSPFVQQR